MESKLPNLEIVAQEMYWMHSQMFMFLDDMVMVAMWSYSKSGWMNSLYNDCLYMVWRTSMQCLALLSNCLMCVFE